MLRFGLRAIAVAALGASLAACSGPRPTGPQGPGPDAEPEHPAYETFDPAGYDAQPPTRVDVVHDVPPRLMQGRVDVPTDNRAPAPPPTETRPRQVEGYRVQIFSSVSKPSADRIQSEAAAWWATVRTQPGAPASSDLLVAYIQPYYRVRMGGFATREEADAALAFVRRRYPEAFIVPDLVTVRE